MKLLLFLVAASAVATSLHFRNKHIAFGTDGGFLSAKTAPPEDWPDAIKTNTKIGVLLDPKGDGQFTGAIEYAALYTEMFGFSLATETSSKRQTPNWNGQTHLDFAGDLTFLLGEDFADTTHAASFWRGTSDVQVQQVVSLKPDALHLLLRMTVINTQHVALENVTMERFFDPDHVSAATTNWNQYDPLKAPFADFPQGFLSWSSDITDDSLMEAAYAAEFTPYADRVKADQFFSLRPSLGRLAPGEQITFPFFYVLDQVDSEGFKNAFVEAGNLQILSPRGNISDSRVAISVWTRTAAGPVTVKLHDGPDSEKLLCTCPSAACVNMTESTGAAYTCHAALSNLTDGSSYVVTAETSDGYDAAGFHFSAGPPEADVKLMLGGAEAKDGEYWGYASANISVAFPAGSALVNTSFFLSGVDGTLLFKVKLEGTGLDSAFMPELDPRFGNTTSLLGVVSVEGILKTGETMKPFTRTAMLSVLPTVPEKKTSDDGLPVWVIVVIIVLVVVVLLAGAAFVALKCVRGKGKKVIPQ